MPSTPSCATYRNRGRGCHERCSRPLTTWATLSLAITALRSSWTLHSDLPVHVRRFGRRRLTRTTRINFSASALRGRYWSFLAGASFRKRLRLLRVVPHLTH